MSWESSGGVIEFANSNSHFPLCDCCVVSSWGHFKVPEQGCKKCCWCEGRVAGALRGSVTKLASTSWVICSSFLWLFIFLPLVKLVRVYAGWHRQMERREPCFVVTESSEHSWIFLYLRLLEWISWLLTSNKTEVCGMNSREMGVEGNLKQITNIIWQKVRHNKIVEFYKNFGGKP